MNNSGTIGNNKSIIDRIEELMKTDVDLDRKTLSQNLIRRYNGQPKDVQLVIDMFFVNLCGVSLGRLIEEHPMVHTSENQPT